MTRKARHQVQQKSFKNLMFETNLMREESFLTDVKLQCQGKEFLVHKLILSAGSPYFKEYFKRNSDTLQAFHLDFINFKTLETVLMFIYQGRIDVTKDSKVLLKDLVEASKTFQIPLLYNHCLKLILDSGSPEQLLTKWNTIEELNSAVLIQIYLEQLHKNIGTLQSTDSFLCLSFRQISSLLNCTIRNPDNEDQILSAVLRWINHRQLDRRTQINDLLKSVDFERISISYLQKLLKEPLLQGNLYFNQNVAKVLSQHLSSKECPKFLRCSTSPHKKMETKTSVFAEIKNTSLSLKSNHPRTEAAVEPKTCQESLNPKFLRHSTSPHKEDTVLAAIMHNCGMLESSHPRTEATVEQKFYQERRTPQEGKKLQKKDSFNKIASLVTEEIEIPSKPIFCYDYWKNGEILEYNLNSKTWVAVKDELVIKSFAKAQYSAVCNVYSSIFFFGGVNDKGNTTNRCFFLDPMKRKCFEIPPMSQSRKHAKAVQLNDAVYIIGGQDENHKYIRANERFNLKTRLWERVPEIPFPYREDNIQVVAVGDRLCLVGEASLLWLDPRSCKWRRGSDLPQRCETKAVIHENGLIFIINEAIKYMLIFDVKTEAWDAFGISDDLVNCSDITNLSKPDKFEFLVVCDSRSFHYKQWSSVVVLNKSRPLFHVESSSKIPFAFPKILRFETTITF